MKSLEEAQAWIGREVSFEGADPVSVADIRRKLEVYCFSCPLHSDEQVARAHGYSRVVAPVSMIPLWAMPPYWSAGQVSPFDPSTPEPTGSFQPTIPTHYSKSVNVQSTWDYFHPVYEGDRLRGTWQLVKIEPKTTRFGDSVFLHSETKLWTQDGVLIASNQNSNLRYHDGTCAAPGPTAANPQAAMQASGWHEIPATDWSRQIRIGDVLMGEELPPVEVSFSYQRIVMSVAADRMFASIHHNGTFARAAGLHDIILNTRGYETLSEIFLRRWIGLDGRIRRLGPLRMLQNIHPGESLSCRATVTGVDRNDTVAPVSLSVEFSSARGITATSSALVGLPV